MSFSEESIRKLADVTARDVYDELVDDGRLEEAVMNSMPMAIESVLGQVSPELVGELGCEVMSRIGITSAISPIEEFNLWRVRYERLYAYVKRNYAESYVDGAEYDIPHQSPDYID